MRPTKVTDTQVPALSPVLEASADAVVVDAEGRIVHANASVATMFGYDVDDLLDRPVEVLLAPEARARHERHRAGFTQVPKARAMGALLDLVACRSDGSRFPVEVRLTPLEADDGLRVIATVADASQRRAYQTLARMNQAILRSAGPLDLYRETCRVAVELGGYIGASVAVPSEGSSVAMVAMAGRIDDYIRSTRISLDESDPRGRGPTARALREGTSQYVVDFVHDGAMTPWNEMARKNGIRASATLPLRCQGRPVAALNLWADQPHVFDDHMRELLEGMADNVSYALEGFDAAERLQALARERAILLQRLVAAQDDERARIAADLHDEPVQALAAAGLRLDQLAAQVRQTAPDLGPSVELVHDILDSVTGGLRTLMFELEAVDVSRPLEEIVRDTADQVLAAGSTVWRVECGDGLQGPAGTLAPATVTQAVRIVREALLNVRRHADASLVVITLRPDADGVEFAVRDDGVGLGRDGAVSPHGHRGLATMRERAQLAGGWLRFDGDASGAVVRFWLPLEPDWAGE